MGLVLARDAARHPDKHPLSWRELLHGPGLRRLFALNRDLLLRTLSLVAAYAWFTRAGAREGDAVLAANAVLMNMNYIAAYGLDGFANATEALVGEFIGARRLNDYRAVLKASAVWAFLVAGAGSLVYLVAGPWLVEVFTNVEAVRVLAMRYLPWAVSLPIVSVAGFQLDGVFIGATRCAGIARQHAGFVFGVSGPGHWVGAVLWQQRAVVCVLRLHGDARRDVGTASAAYRARLQVGRSSFLRILIRALGGGQDSTQFPEGAIENAWLRLAALLPTFSPNCAATAAPAPIRRTIVGLFGINRSWADSARLTPLCLLPFCVHVELDPARRNRSTAGSASPP